MTDYLAGEDKLERVVTTCVEPIPKKCIYFTQADTETLRSLIKPPWETATREMLLAYLHNRYPCGYFMCDEEPLSPMTEVQDEISKE